MLNDEHGKFANTKIITLYGCTGGTPRLGIFALKDLEKGTEIRYNYGVKDLPWRKVRILHRLSVFNMSRKSFVATISVVGLETGFSWSRSWSRSRYPVVSVLVSVSDLSGLEDLTGLVSRPAFLTTLQHMNIIDYSFLFFIWFR